jgi:hypothetical protein
VVDHVLTYHLVYGDYHGVEGDWIMSCPEVNCVWNYDWGDACSPLLPSRQKLYNACVQSALVHLDIHRQLEHSKEGRLGMIVMECEACGYSTQGYKKGRLKKRLEIHLSKCTVATPCEVEQHQPTSPAEHNRHKEQLEHRHEDRDPPDHSQHESPGEKVHKVVANLVELELAHV